MRIRMIVNCPSCGNEFIHKLTANNNGYTVTGASCLCCCGTELQFEINIATTSRKIKKFIAT